jgi:DNA repair protein RecO (recombination protein O)
MKRVTFEAAYVLHRRPYRETSALVELLSRDHGRLTVIAKGVRQTRSSTQGLLQPFVPLNVSWVGKGELMTLSDVEPNGAALTLTGDFLFAGFYLNELLMSLLQKWDPHPALFANYEQSIAALNQQKTLETTLRLFEKRLLEELGYGVLPSAAAEINRQFEETEYYRFLPEQGFILDQSQMDREQVLPSVFLGANLKAIALEDWSNEEILRDAKRLMRLVLAPLLGVRPIYSRRLFLPLEEESKHES